ncbi:unnamed protein product [Pleuronectes platessa]|uniref:Uncharacterized protein n=1 Tax=Pleuronectes platessa TaxID=8262 RepID=A0A9N7YX44_PLEPL|nr:unnamed protein product [Pleuronectes platessa]
MTCQGSRCITVQMSNQQDHHPSSRPERRSSPQSPSTAAHQDPPRAVVLVHRPYRMFSMTSDLCQASILKPDAGEAYVCP